MNKEKQIEEMTLEIAKLFCNPKGCYNCNLCDAYGSLELSCEEYLSYRRMASVLYAAGYRKQSGWIGVDEEPTENGTYLCYGYWIGSGTYQMETADYIGEWDIVNNFVLTHWMPLPEPPKGE